MAIDKSILTAIESAVEAEPANVALRLHLISLLFDDAQFGESLKHAQIVLAQEPTNTDALRKAADAAEKLGDLGKAESYRKVLNALSGKNETEKSLPTHTPSFSSNDDWATF